MVDELEGESVDELEGDSLEGDSLEGVSDAGLSGDEDDDDDDFTLNRPAITIISEPCESCSA